MTAKADRARELVNHPSMQEAFANLKQFYVDHLVEQVPSAEANMNADVLMDLKRMLHLTDQLKRDLEKMIEAGNLEDFRAAQPEYLPDLRKNYG